MNLFVIPHNQTGWTMAWADFAKALVAQWPGAKTRTLKKGGEFELDMPHGALYGSFKLLAETPSPTLIVGHGDFEDCAALVLWYRALVPWAQTLVFCDEGYAYSITLEAETTQEDIFRAFDYPS